MPVIRREDAAQRDAVKLHGAAGDAVQIDGDLVHRQVERGFGKHAVRLEAEIAKSGQMGARFVARERSVVDQQAARAPVIAAEKPERLDMQRRAETGDGAGRADAEIGGADLRAMREREGARHIGLERVGFQKRKRLGVGAERTHIQSGNREIAFQIAVALRQLHTAHDMGAMAGNFDLCIDAGDDHACLRDAGGGNFQRRVGCDDKKPRSLIVESQARLAHRETLQRRRAPAALGDGAANVFKHIALALLLLHAEPQMAVRRAHKRELHADKRDALDLDPALEKRCGRQNDLGLGGLGNDALVFVEHARAQNDQIDPALVARPFECGFVVAHGEARQRLRDGLLKLAA